MSTLLELVNVGRKVKIGEKDEIDVYGVSAEGFASLLVRFPALLKAFSGVTPDAASLTKIAPEAITAFIAAACGYPGDKKAEAVASKMPVSDQLNILEAAIKQTFPQGVGPFVKRLEAVGLLVQVENQSSQPSGDQSSNSKAPATKA